MLHLRAGLNLLLNGLNSLAEPQAGTVQQTVCLLDAAAVGRRYAGPGDTHAVQAAGPGREAVNNSIRHHIMDIPGHAADHGLLAHTNKLMNTGLAADNSPVLNHYMACHHGGICHDNIVAQHAVVGYMHIGHQKAVITDAGVFPFTGSPMNGAELMDFRPVTDDSVALFPGKFQILRLLANGSPLENMTVLANLCPAGNHHAWPYNSSLVYFYIFTNNSKRPYFYIFTNFCIWMNHSKIMYLCSNIKVIRHLSQLL